MTEAMTEKRYPWFSVILGICIFALVLASMAGCGGGGSDSGSNSGTLKVAITDKPSDDFDKLVIAIREIRVVPAGKENALDNDPGLPVVVHFDTPRVVDVMQLRFIQQALGEVGLPAGRYNQLRLILEPNPNGQGQPPLNYLTFKTDPATKIPLITPSGQQSGLKILGHIEIKPDAITAVAIDFDPNTAVVPRGNSEYNFKPTGIRLVEMSDSLSTYGSIGGTVVSGFKSWSSATVAIKRRGAVNDNDPISAARIFSSYSSGRWVAPFTAFVPPSTDTVSYKTFVTVTGFRTYSSPSLAVVEGAMTDLHEITLVPVP